MTPPLAAVDPRPLLAVITPRTSVLLRTSDRDGIAQQLLGMDSGTVLACSSFASSESAMCWLTDPGSIDAVSTGAPKGDGSPVSLPNVSAGWLAVISRGCRSCFEVDRSGVGGALQLLLTSPSALCVVARFSAPGHAYQWLTGLAADAVLEVLTSTASACGRIAGLPPQSASADLVAIEPGPLVVAAAPLACSGSPCGGVAKGARQADLSPSAGGGQSQRTATSSGGKGFIGSSTCGSATAPLSSMRAACGSSVRSGASTSTRQTGFASSTWRHGPRRPRPLSGMAPSKRDGQRGGQVSARGRGDSSGHDWGQLRRSSPPSAKRARLCGEGAPPASLNPAAVIPDGSAPTFTFETVRHMMGESLAAWEQDDVDEALRRDADLRLRPGAAVKDGVEAELGDAVVVAARKAGDNIVGAGHGVREMTGAIAASSTGTCSDGDAWHDEGRRAKPGPISQMAADLSWTAVYARLFERSQSTFVSGGPGVGKTSFLRGFVSFLRHRVPAPNAVVVVAPTGSAAKTAKGVTYHSFFGFVKEYKMQLPNPVDEAARMLALERWKPIARRLAKVEFLLMDEISMVPADNLDVMYELLRQSRTRHAPPFLIYAFGDFLQLCPPFGEMAFTARCWRPVFSGALLELTHVYRQGQPDFVAALDDARFGRCTAAVQKLVDECTVSDEKYKELECAVLHLMPRHEDVRAHNAMCLARLSLGKRPDDFIATDGVKLDPNRDGRVREPDVTTVSSHSRDAALLDCVAPRIVQHCLQARVMLITNQFLGMGLFHGSIGQLVDYDEADGSPVVRFDNHEVVPGFRSFQGVRDAGADWIEVFCPPVDFEARVFSRPGCLAVRRQVPFVLGWAITVHRSQSLTLSEAVLEVGDAFGAGMVLAAMSRVSDKRRMYVRSFAGSRLLADRAALQLYRESSRL